MTREAELRAAAYASARRTILPHSVELPVLGIMTRFETNSPEVHALVNEKFGPWDAVRLESPVPAVPRAHVRVIVHAGSEHVVGRAPVVHVCPDDLRMIAYSPGSFAISDPTRGEVFAYVTAELVADREHFHDQVLQAMTLALLSSWDRHFVHAAAIARRSRAIVLAAASGTGKSTLSYLAHASGLEVMSEDRIWIQQSPALRVWGWPLQLHLRPDAARHFPELAAQQTQSHGDGKQRLVVDLAPMAGRERQFYADDAVVCLLERGDGAASIERVEEHVIVESLCGDVAPGFDRHAAQHEPAVRAIAHGGGWRLRLSSNPHDALTLLLRMLDG